MKLYLVRHAESTANVRKVLDTALPGPPLTDLGQQQAQTLADRLSGEPIAAVYASRATRAQQTAAPLAAALTLEVQVIDGVHEVGVGELEGRGDVEALKTYAGTVHPWTRGDLAVAMPGGESGEQVRTRYLAAVADLRAKHEDDAAIALVSHGGAIRLAAEWLADNVRPELADQGLIPNTGLVELESVPGAGWHCLTWVGAEM
ncbi:histidine phosphatase family protein [Amycolatopsis acidiphila]|uniref:Histidine phosphatase family protein n=1 Tax=Amycolatopsis acidiphila TaxID=715473 RepID=A0A558AMN3_9PSEU|nr:histidine phosphatase family protein [Amycolatopsis acidiphila]TVT25519.1 histidine phosphatase family protein [Amycolatopsis acidiphila]UIJ60262.1 histidine phosphatase family protein [Amycolatopsis acidiphila]GHG60433.1 phosphoglycerate mutase [Amycolatopsis acidiphila]